MLVNVKYTNWCAPYKKNIIYSEKKMFQVTSLYLRKSNDQSP